MTVSSTTRKAGPFAGNGVGTVFPFTFKVFVNTDVEVLRVDANGNPTTLTLDSDYSIALNPDQDSNPGGTITYPVTGTPLPLTYQLVALGGLPDDQPTDITNQGGFYPSVIEDMADRSTIQIQQLAEQVSRCIAVGAADTSTPALPNSAARANMLLGFDATGALELLPLTASVGAGDLRNESWTAGTDYVAGTATSVALSRAYTTKANLGTVVMAGVSQDPLTYSLTNGGLTLQFDSIIPAFVNRIWCVGGTTLSQGIPPAGTVNDASVATGTKLSNRINSFIDVRDPPYGAHCDGVFDDTLAIQAAITAASASTVSRRVYIPGKPKITAPLTINVPGLMLFGDGMQDSQLVASGNFSAVLSFQGSASYCFTRDLGVITTGTTTKAVNIAQNAVVIRFSQCYFDGDLNGDLVYSNGQNPDFDKCTWQLRTSNTWGINFDCFNQNPGVTDCRFGGPGNGLRVTNVFSPANQQQGLRIVGTYFINTGPYNVWLGNSFLTTITGCALDQSSAHALHLDNGAGGVLVSNSYLGSSVLTGVGVYCAEQSSLIQLVNLFHGYGTYGVVAHATTANRVDGLTISNCTYSLPGNPASSPLLLDSVINCTVSNCVDVNANATNGSWGTQGTFGPGQYSFSNNSWNTALPLVYHAGSSYNFVNERGIVGRKKSTSAATGGTSLTVNHGLFTTPSTILLTQQGNANAGAAYISAITSGQFVINWTNAGTPTWFWEADCSH